MTEIILILTVILTIASIASYLLRHRKVPRYSVYILTGFSIGLFVEISQIIELVTLGAVFLLFYLALRANPHLYDHDITVNVKTVILTTLFTAIPIFFILQYIGFSEFESLLISLSMATGSSLVSINLVDREIKEGLLQGKLTESLNLIHDFIIICILGVLSLPVNPIGDLVIFISLVVAAYIIKEKLAIAFHFVCGENNEMKLLLAIVILFGFASLTEFLGLGLLTGAFIAGLSLSSHTISFDIRENIQPLEEFFVVILFVSFGLFIGIPTWQSFHLAILIVLLTFVFVIIQQVILTKLGVHPKTSFYTSIQMDQVSEFLVIMSLILVMQGKISSLIFQAMALAFFITTITSLLTDSFRESIFTKFNFEKYQESKDVPEKNHIIIGGVSDVGHKLFAHLKSNNEKIVGVDEDPQRIKNIGNWVIGDMRKENTWEKANYLKAKKIILFNEAGVKLVKKVKAKKYLVSEESIEGFEHVSINDPEAIMFDELVEELLKA